MYRIPSSAADDLAQFFGLDERGRDLPLGAIDLDMQRMSGAQMEFFAGRLLGFAQMQGDILKTRCQTANGLYPIR